MTHNASPDATTRELPATIARLLTTRTRSAGHRPLLTCYDDTTGARTELSYATLDNWAAKSANLLADEFDCGPGTIVGFDLDGHWTTTALALACWKLGAAVAPGAGSAGDAHAVVCCHERHATRHPSGPVLVVGDGFRAEPLTAVDERDGLLLLGEHVHGFGDDYDDPAVAASTPALVGQRGTVTHGAMIARASAWRRQLGDGPRVGLAAALDHERAFDLLAGVIAAGGGLVAVRAQGDPRYAQRWATERVTAIAGPAGTAPDAAGDGAALVTFDRVAAPR